MVRQWSLRTVFGFIKELASEAKGLLDFSDPLRPYNRRLAQRAPNSFATDASDKPIA